MDGMTKMSVMVGITEMAVISVREMSKISEMAVIWEMLKISEMSGILYGKVQKVGYVGHLEDGDVRGRWQ